MKEELLIEAVLIENMYSIPIVVCLYNLTVCGSRNSFWQFVVRSRGEQEYANKISGDNQNIKKHRHWCPHEQISTRFSPLGSHFRNVSRQLSVQQRQTHTRTRVLKIFIINVTIWSKYFHNRFSRLPPTAAVFPFLFSLPCETQHEVNKLKWTFPLSLVIFGSFPMEAVDVSETKQSVKFSLAGRQFSQRCTETYVESVNLSAHGRQWFDFAVRLSTTLITALLPPSLPPTHERSFPREEVKTGNWFGDENPPPCGHDGQLWWLKALKGSSSHKAGDDVH